MSRSRKQRTGRKLTGGKAKSITVHNTATKDAPADNFRRVHLRDQSASWHITVDDREAILHIPLDEQAWHSGTNAGNTTSVGIEVCEFTDPRRTAAAIANAQKLIAGMLSGSLGPAWDLSHLSLSDVRTHQSWEQYGPGRGKFCPHLILPMWSSFIYGIGNLMQTAQPKPVPVTKSISQLADEVIAGKHGTGDARRRSLDSLYSAVQAEVNRRLSGAPVKTASKAASKPKPAAPTPKRKTVAQIATEVIAGKWGVGNTRKVRLTLAGYNYRAVQTEVNRRLGAK